MRKLVYETPVMTEDVFMADEYVAACGWTIACTIGEQGGVNGADDPIKAQGVTHNAYANETGCGWAESQIVSVEDGTVSMLEYNKVNNSYNRDCTLTDANWNKKTYNANEIEEGQTIYWTTSASGNRTWHHYGTVGNVSNHS